MLFRQDEILIGDTVFSRFFRVTGKVTSLDEDADVIGVSFSNGYVVAYKSNGTAISVIPNYSRNDLEWWDVTKVAVARKNGTVEIKNASISLTK